MNIQRIKCFVGMHKIHRAYWGDLEICDRCKKYKWHSAFVPKGVCQYIDNRLATLTNDKEVINE